MPKEAEPCFLFVENSEITQKIKSVGSSENRHLLIVWVAKFATLFVQVVTSNYKILAGEKLFIFIFVLIKFLHHSCYYTKKMFSITTYSLEILRFFWSRRPPPPRTAASWKRIKRRASAWIKIVRSGVAVCRLARRYSKISVRSLRARYGEAAFKSTVTVFFHSPE